MLKLDEKTLNKIEAAYPKGLTSAQILEICAAAGLQLTEATLRKYVQLGLLPRSVRVGQKGKHRGSHGLYPARVIRQVVQVKELLASRFTIEQLKREALFARGELEQLEGLLGQMFEQLDDTLPERSRGDAQPFWERELHEVQGLGEELLTRLRRLEGRLGWSRWVQASEVREVCQIAG